MDTTFPLSVQMKSFRQVRVDGLGKPAILGPGSGIVPVQMDGRVARIELSYRFILSETAQARSSSLADGCGGVAHVSVSWYDFPNFSSIRPRTDQGSLRFSVILLTFFGTDKCRIWSPTTY